MASLYKIFGIVFIVFLCVYMGYTKKPGTVSCKTVKQNPNMKNKKCQELCNVTKCVVCYKQTGECTKCAKGHTCEVYKGPVDILSSTTQLRTTLSTKNTNTTHKVPSLIETTAMPVVKQTSGKIGPKAPKQGTVSCKTVKRKRNIKNKNCQELCNVTKCVECYRKTGECTKCQKGHTCDLNKSTVDSTIQSTLLTRSTAMTEKVPNYIEITTMPVVNHTSGKTVPEALNVTEMSMLDYIDVQTTLNYSVASEAADVDKSNPTTESNLLFPTLDYNVASEAADVDKSNPTTESNLLYPTLDGISERVHVYTSSIWSGPDKITRTIWTKNKEMESTLLPVQMDTSTLGIGWSKGLDSTEFMHKNPNTQITIESIGGDKTLHSTTSDDIKYGDILIKNIPEEVVTRSSTHKDNAVSVTGTNTEEIKIDNMSTKGATVEEEHTFDVLFDSTSNKDTTVDDYILVSKKVLGTSYPEVSAGDGVSQIFQEQTTTERETVEDVHTVHLPFDGTSDKEKPVTVDDQTILGTQYGDILMSTTHDKVVTWSSTHQDNAVSDSSNTGEIKIDHMSTKGATVEEEHTVDVLFDSTSNKDTIVDDHILVSKTVLRTSPYPEVSARDEVSQTFQEQTTEDLQLDGTSNKDKTADDHILYFKTVLETSLYPEVSTRDVVSQTLQEQTREERKSSTIFATDRYYGQDNNSMKPTIVSDDIFTVETAHTKSQSNRTDTILKFVIYSLVTLCVLVLGITLFFLIKSVYSRNQRRKLFRISTQTGTLMHNPAASAECSVFVQSKDNGLATNKMDSDTPGAVKYPEEVLNEKEHADNHSISMYDNVSQASKTKQVSQPSPLAGAETQLEQGASVKTDTDKNTPV